MFLRYTDHFGCVYNLQIRDIIIVRREETLQETLQAR